MKKSRYVGGIGATTLMMVSVWAPAVAQAAPAPSSSDGDAGAVIMVDDHGLRYEIPIEPASSDETLPAAAGTGDISQIEGAEQLSELPEMAFTAVDPGPVPSSPIAKKPIASDFKSPRVVVDSDDRRRVNSRATPYMQQPLLLFRTPNGHSMRCTGALIGPRTLVTAGHCLHTYENGGWSTSMKALFGVGAGPSGLAAYVSCPATRIAAPETWTKTNLPGWDWGVVQLGCDVGSHIGYMGYKDPGNGVPSGRWNISGYPGDKPEYSFWTASGPLGAGPSNIRFRYKIDTARGQSGAPIWQYQAGCGNCVIGVHTTGYTDSATNRGVLNEGSKLTASFKAVTDHFRNG